MSRNYKQEHQNRAENRANLHCYVDKNLANKFKNRLKEQKLKYSVWLVENIKKFLESN
jgi:hypothetical protein